MSQKLEVKEDRRGELRREICNTIMVIMDLARFLLKSVNYRDEREYRVIQYSSNPKCDEEGGDIPRFYVEMERPIVYSKVCFGPLTSNFDSVAAYVRNIKKDGKEIEERVHWDIEVCKSEISYR